ncbi:hypothetical protein [Halorhabdus rudnickae]|uniref:hypothetical protein n=1 Tax=Halorhabdus rudnickae TaxID=1775544 RepID=UPI00108374C8|nr:hypothetical protein [Halorhabdus rudnickae]
MLVPPVILTALVTTVGLWVNPIVETVAVGPVHAMAQTYRIVQGESNSHPSITDSGHARADTL